MRFTNTLVFIAVLTASASSEAWIGEAFRKKAGECAVSLGNAATAASKNAVEAAEQAKNLVALEKQMASFGILIEQVGQISCQAASCGTTFTWTVTKSLPGAALRVGMFNLFGGDLDSIKNDFVIPLAGRIRQLAAHRDAKSLEGQSAEVARLTVLLAETTLKLPKIAAGGLASDIKEILVDRLVEILQSKELTWDQKMDALTGRNGAEDFLGPALAEMARRAGWGDLNEEILRFNSEK